MSRERVRYAKAAGQLRRTHLSTQLEQPQRVPARVGHDPVANLLVQVAGHGSREQGAGVFVREPLDRQRREGR